MNYFIISNILKDMFTGRVIFYIACLVLSVLLTFFSSEMINGDIFLLTAVSVIGGLFGFIIYAAAQFRLAKINRLFILSAAGSIGGICLFPNPLSVFASLAAQILVINAAGKLPDDIKAQNDKGMSKLFTVLIIVFGCIEAVMNFIVLVTVEADALKTFILFLYFMSGCTKNLLYLIYLHKVKSAAKLAADRNL